MKKIVAALLTIILLFAGTAVSAEGIDFSAMTAEELQTIIDMARLELTKYHPEAADGTVLYEDENVRITFTGKIELDSIFDQLSIHVIAENLSDHNLTVYLENASCNGWSIWEASLDVPANKKAKTTFGFMSAAEDAELETAEDVTDIEADLKYWDSDTWDDLIEPAHVTWLF